MKKTAVIFIVLMIHITKINVSAQEKTDFAAGIIIGEPTGISLKYDNLAAGIAWSLSNNFHLHCDYRLHRTIVKKPVDWYTGAGAKIRVFSDKSKDEHDNDTLGLGVRVPVGLQFFLIPDLELFAEIVPGISLFPATEFDLDGGVGARYLF